MEADLFSVTEQPKNFPKTVEIDKIPDENVKAVKCIKQNNNTFNTFLWRPNIGFYSTCYLAYLFSHIVFQCVPVPVNYQ